MEGKIYEIVAYDPDKRVVAHLEQVAALLSLAEERALLPTPITPEPLKVLLVAEANPDPTTPAVIAKALALRPQSVAGQLNRMERQDLIRRVPKRKGKPYTDIEVQPSGEFVRSRGKPVLEALMRRTVEGMDTEDKRTVVALLRLLRDNLLDELHMEVVAPPWKPSWEIGGQLRKTAVGNNGHDA